MLPLRDNVHADSFPIVNWMLIGANTLVFLYQSSLGPAALERFVTRFGMIPQRLDWLHPSLAWATLVTAIFLHGGWLHLLSNMWVLYIFGDNVEDRLGSGRYLVFYLLSGVVANGLQAVVFPASRVPAIGASGAIAGVLGAYFLLHPKARVITLIPVFLFPWIVELPALLFLGFWFVLQLFSGFAALELPAQAQVGGVAWWAHIGGFVFGLLAVHLFARRHRAFTRRYPDEYWPY